MSALGPDVRGLSEALVFPGAATGDLAGRITDVLSGAVKLPDAAACVAYARERYGWDTVIAKVRGVYEEALG